MAEATKDENREGGGVHFTRQEASANQNPNPAPPFPAPAIQMHPTPKLSVMRDNQADAVLMAAAPDLLAACKAMDKWLDGWCPSQCNCAYTAREIHVEMRTAIERAEGKA